jgi:hypothetical protein
MNANGKAQIAGVLLSVGIGCSSTSIERVGAATPKDGLIRATSSKYQIFHIEWGNDAIGSLAQSRGIRYVLGSSHRKAGIPIVFNKRETTIFGFATKESFDEWKVKNSVQSKPPALEALARAETELQALDRAEAELRALARAEAELRAFAQAEAELRASTMSVKPNENQIVAELRR